TGVDDDALRRRAYRKSLDVTRHHAVVVGEMRYQPTDLLNRSLRCGRNDDVEYSGQIGLDDRLDRDVADLPLPHRFDLERREAHDYTAGPFGAPRRRPASAGLQDGDIGTRVQPSRLLAIAAPCTSASNFAHAICGCTRPPRPQSVPAMTFS